MAARRVFPKHTRKERRKLTLARAKLIAKQRHMTRLQMHFVWKDLQTHFPEGTIP